MKEKNQIIWICYSVFICSETNDILQIISNQLGSTLEDLSLDESNAMKRWDALAAANKLAKVTVKEIQTVDYEMLRHVCVMPSLIELLQTFKNKYSPNIGTYNL